MYNISVDPKNIFYISVAIGVLVFAGAIAYAVFRLAKVFKALQTLVEDIEDTTKKVRLLKDKLKSNSFSLLAMLLKRVVK